MTWRMVGIDQDRYIGIRLQGLVRAILPPALKPQHRLWLYAQHFNTIELNITYYQLLSEGAVGGLINKVDIGFDFFINANRDLTHGTRKNAKDTMVKFAGMTDFFPPGA